MHGDDIVEAAARIAVMAHAGQTRKGSDCPYAVHPITIAMRLARRGFPDAVVAAALAHDVLEDTDFPPEKLREAIGDEAFAIVQAVSMDPTLSWEDRRRLYIKTVREASDGAKAVATADKIHNAESLLDGYAQQGPAVWKNFNTGRDMKLWFERAMLEMLRESWQDPMIDEYGTLVVKLESLEG